jgi:hypothetical protein
MKTGGRLVKHARQYWRLLAESHLTRRRLFGAMLGRMAALPPPPAREASGWSMPISATREAREGKVPGFRAR